MTRAEAIEIITGALETPETYDDALRVLAQESTESPETITERERLAEELSEWKAKYNELQPKYTALFKDVTNPDAHRRIEDEVIRNEEENITEYKDLVFYDARTE